MYEYSGRLRLVQFAPGLEVFQDSLIVSAIAWPSYMCDETKLAAAVAEARYLGSEVNSKRWADSL